MLSVALRASRLQHCWWGGGRHQVHCRLSWVGPHPIALQEGMLSGHRLGLHQLRSKGQCAGGAHFSGGTPRAPEVVPQESGP